MRIESSVLSVSWIPSEAVTGLPKQAFEVGVTHYDEPPPDAVSSVHQLEALRDAARFRFANRLAAWIEVDDGRIVDAGYAGGGMMGITTVNIGHRRVRFEPVALPDRQADPERRRPGSCRRPVAARRSRRRAPSGTLRSSSSKAPDVWTTLALTIRADGQSEFEVVGASPFPRHWIYDADGRLVAKAGLADFHGWYRSAFGKHTPWGDHESEAYVTAVETALERRLSTTIMRGDAKPEIRTLDAGGILTEQGTLGGELYLLLDGVLDVIVDGEPIAEVGPGAILGERALLEGGDRTATLRAVTTCRVAVAMPDQVDRGALVDLSQTHHREDASPAGA